MSSNLFQFLLTREHKGFLYRYTPCPYRRRSMGVFGYKTFSSLYDFYRLLRKREIDDVPGIISAGAAPTAVEEHSSDFVDRNPFILLDLFEVGWRETRLFFELPGKVLLAAVIEHVSDLDRKSTRLNSSHVAISYAVFCLKKKKKAKSN